MSKSNYDIRQSGSISPDIKIDAWVVLIAGIIFPPLVFLMLKKMMAAFLSLTSILASLVIGNIYNSLGTWPFALWLFPMFLGVYGLSIFYLYKTIFVNSVSISYTKVGMLSWLILFSGACIYLFGSNFVLSRYAISSVSMNPTLIHGDYVITRKSAENKNSNWLVKFFQQDVHTRGDLVVFQHPEAEEIYVKRIIAVAGDKVAYNGVELSINETRLNRRLIKTNENNTPFRWLKNELYYEYNQDSQYKISFSGESASVKGQITIPQGFVFVMGDNRNQSIDSRFWGLLPEENILEVPVLIWWSIEPGPNPRIRWERLGNWID